MSPAERELTALNIYPCINTNKPAVYIACVDNRTNKKWDITRRTIKRLTRILWGISLKRREFYFHRNNRRREAVRIALSPGQRFISTFKVPFARYTTARAAEMGRRLGGSLSSSIFKVSRRFRREIADERCRRLAYWLQRCADGRASILRQKRSVKFYAVENVILAARIYVHDQNSTRDQWLDVASRSSFKRNKRISIKTRWCMYDKSVGTARPLCRF